MSNFKYGQNCMSFCLGLADFIDDPSAIPIMGVRDEHPSPALDQTLEISSQQHVEPSVTLLHSAQQNDGTNDCGPSVIQHMYCEAFGRYQRIDSRNLNGSGMYRKQISLAIEENNVSYLNPSYTLTDEEMSREINVPHVPADSLITERDWASLHPLGMLEDVIVTLCGDLIQNEISRLAADGSLNTGTVFITDSLFAGCVLDTEAEPSERELKFIKPEMFSAAKVMIPVVRNKHWYLYVYSQPPYPSCLWSPMNF